METSQRYFIPPEKWDMAGKLHIPVGVPLQVLQVGYPFVFFERGDIFKRIRIEVSDCLYLRKDRRNPSSETVSIARAEQIQASLHGAFQSPHSPPKNPFRSTDDYADAHHISIQSMSRTCPFGPKDVLQQEMIERATLIVRVLKYLLFPNVFSLLQYFRARIPDDIFDRHCRNEQWRFLIEHQDNSLAAFYIMASGSYTTYAEFFSYFLREIFLKSLREEIDRKEKVFQDLKGLWNSVPLTREEILLIRQQIMPFIRQLLTILRKRN